MLRHRQILITLIDPLEPDGSWLMQMDCSGWSFAVKVFGKEVARGLHAFVRDHANREIAAEYRIGTFQSAEVTLVKDADFIDRFWLRIQDGRTRLAEIAIRDEESVALLNALHELVEVLEFERAQPLPRGTHAWISSESFQPWMAAQANRRGWSYVAG